MKHNPSVGEKLYLYQPCNMYYVQAVRDPFTVESVKGNTIVIRAAKPLFPRPRYYNTMPYDIVDDPNGERITMKWSEKKTEMAGIACGKLSESGCLRRMGFLPVP